MKKKKVTILDKEKIAHKLRRMAYEIWERNSEEDEIVLIGIEKGGKIVADNLTEIVREISPLSVKCLPLTINKKSPLDFFIDFDENLTGKTVILVDDVANSGKTLMYCFPGILAYELKKVMVAVLVDRMHKSFPIASDIVGLKVATTLQEQIVVATKGKQVIEVYLE